MKIINKETGKEVKGTVAYTAAGHPDVVNVDGVNYAASAFEFQEEKTSKKTRTEDRNSEVMTTKSAPTKKGKRS